MTPRPPTSFPRPDDYISSDDSNLSVVVTRTTALDVCRSIYGDTTISVPSIDALYEANASTYENPLLTATSRSVIGDIHRLANSISSVDIPRPLAALCTLFRLQPPKDALNPLFQALRAWTDVEDVCESESFDGHRKAIIEHTLHILFLPGIHHDDMDQCFPTDTLNSLVSPTRDYPTFPSYPSLSPPWLPIPGTSFSIPSPFHFNLHIVTRLSFNEQGLVTHHRDIWDVKDVLGLMPGISLVQWIGTRMVAAGLSYTSKIWSRCGTKDFMARSTDAAQCRSKPREPDNEANYPTELEDNSRTTPEYKHMEIWDSVWL